MRDIAVLSGVRPVDSFREENEAPRSRIIPIIAALVAVFIAWAAFARVDEVAVGSARVTPSSKSQLVQSLEGGIIEEIFVREGDLVDAGQKLATLDRVRFMATVGEAEARALSLEAAAARLKAEIEGGEPRFSGEVLAVPELVARERELLRSRRQNLRENTEGLEESLRLVRREISLTEPLVELGAASEVELIRLRRQENELVAKLAGVRNQYLADANAEYAKTMSELEVVRQVISGRRDQLERTALTSPVRGIVKNLEHTTIGGVVAPGGTLMEIVPVEDTLQDEVHRDQVYYRAYLRTSGSTLRTRDGREHAIMPGMVATVDIRTGSKTILDYLLKPVNKAREALRER